MRDFFKKEVLDRTYEIFGVRQTDEEKMSDDDIKFLLDGLCQVSKNYSYIPEAEQKKIISACMLSDKTYRNINLRLVAGWLEQNGKKYFTESAHKPSEQQPTPLEGEERDRWLELWKKELAKVNTQFTTGEFKGNGAKMRENLDEHGVKFDETKHKKYDPNDTTDLQEMLAEHEAINKQGSEGAIENTGIPENTPDTAQPDENFSQQRENI